ncbi:hypothetical protein IWZ00DRAFT_527 [Phyllosticta capitalensis]
MDAQLQRRSSRRSLGPPTTATSPDLANSPPLVQYHSAPAYQASSVTMDNPDQPPNRTIRASLHALKSRFKTTHGMVSETRAKFAKIERGLSQLQGLRRKREVAVNLERSHMEQTTAELKALSIYAQEAADGISKKEEDKRRREPRTPPGKMTPTYGWVEPGQRVGRAMAQQQPPKAKGRDRKPDSKRDSGVEIFYDARQERVASPVKRKKRGSAGSDDNGFVSARQSLEDPFIE